MRRAAGLSLAAGAVHAQRAPAGIGVTGVTVAPEGVLAPGRRGVLTLRVSSSGRSSAIVALRVAAGAGIRFPAADCDGNGGPRGTCSFTLAMDPGEVDVPLGFTAGSPGRYRLRISPKPAAAAGEPVIRVGGLALRVARTGPRQANRFVVSGQVVGQPNCAAGKVHVTGITSRRSPPIDLRPVPGTTDDCLWGGGKAFTVNFSEVDDVKRIRATYEVGGKRVLTSRTQTVRIVG